MSPRAVRTAIKAKKFDPTCLPSIVAFYKKKVPQ
jgi:hypothetical protein